MVLLLNLFTGNINKLHVKQNKKKTKKKKKKKNNLK